MTSKDSSYFYKPELDVIRFLAFMMVFLLHALPNDEKLYSKYTSVFWGRILSCVNTSFIFGLSLFFFLSAYLITTLLTKEHQEYGKIDLKAFYIRRILRIWPLYFAGILVWLILTLLFNPKDIGAFKWYILFFGNIYNQYHAAISWMPHLWSISVEEQFYVLFPLLILIFGVVRMTQIGFSFVFISLVSLVIQGTQRVDTNFYWCNSLSEFIFFGVGIIMAAYTGKYEIKINLSVRILVLVVAIICFFSSVFFLDIERTDFAVSGINLVFGFLIVSFGCVLVLFSFLNANLKFPNCLLFLGKISYGLYVWHYFFLTIVWKYMDYLISGGKDHYLVHVYGVLASFLSIVPTVVTAIISYRYLELPFLKLKNKFTIIKNRAE